MKYKAVFANSFSRHEQKKFGYGAFAGCLIIILTSFVVYKPSFSYLPVANLRFSIDAGLRLPTIEEAPHLFANEETKPEIRILSKTESTELKVPDRNIIQQKIRTLPDNAPKQDIKAADNKLKQEIKVSINSTEIKLEAKFSNTEMKPPVCDVSDSMTDFCDISGDVRIHGKSSSVLFSTSSQNATYTRNESWKVKPYPRKADPEAMSSVSQFSVKSFINNNDKEVPECNFSHNVPAIIFSTAGYSWNHFHAYTDVLIPLFLTSHKFNQEVQFLITSSSQYWIHKYEEIFKHLSRYPIIDIDNEDNVHCYKRVIVGLKVHKEFDIDPTKSPKGYSMTDFTRFIRNAYAINTKSSAIKIKRNRKSKNQQLRPRLLLVSRKRSRKITNEDELVDMARSLGYEVIVSEPRTGMNYSRFAEVVSTCDVMLGVHGAGLTNIVFLPVNAILIQIVPLGGLEGACRTDFGEPAKDMKLRYLEYKISEKESSLIQQYPLDHAVLRDPRSITKQGWKALKDIYLDKQDVRIDVHRFRPTLLNALELLRK
ncbi:uncharacterized protein LOC113282171 isoform X1 [Papaver somniferum]|uniref:uncharacterized protein LOC113282171 isoform X1 n=1 Tax=Papaver somniferum TaxID=3469 RepID=UPI000E6FED5F|nr:uncharacterized protein LOC113282171 isoform X1 [Papaver somniferum]